MKFNTFFVGKLARLVDFSLKPLADRNRYNLTQTEIGQCFGKGKRKRKVIKEHHIQPSEPFGQSSFPTAGYGENETVSATTDSIMLLCLFNRI